MYLQKIFLENIGPIQKLELEMPFYNNGNPKPVVIVGGNGAGKTIILSHIINALLSAKQIAYQNTEVEEGKVYKLRSPSYISSGGHYSFASIIFEKDFQIKEWQLIQPRKDFENNLKYTPINTSWNDIPENESNHFWSNFPQKK
jgi:predicted ATP-binding protein involved in virulence